MQAAAVPACCTASAALIPAAATATFDHLASAAVATTLTSAAGHPTVITSIMQQWDTE